MNSGEPTTGNSSELASEAGSDIRFLLVAQGRPGQARTH
jgi:hypothetical protein